MQTLYVREAIPNQQYSTAEQKLHEQGPESMLDGELLMVIAGVEQDKAKLVLKHFPLPQLYDLPLPELKRIIGIKPARTLIASLELAKRSLEKGLGVQPVISCPADTLPFLQDIKDKDKEHFKALFLNARNQATFSEVISVGSLSCSVVHPRELFKIAIQHSAASIILAHNHPSSLVDPSKDDLELTKRLVSGGELLGIEILDHIIISQDNFISMKEQNLI